MAQGRRKKLEPIPVLVPFGKHVASLRKRLDPPLSQEDLSDLCDLDRTYISGIETGKRNVGLVNLFRLARALRIEPKDLLDFPGAGNEE